VDFSHIRNLMKNGGGSLLAIGTGEGENKVMDALEHALHHPMLEAINLEDANGIIANFTGGTDLSFVEVMEALNHLHEQTHSDAEIIPGVITDERMEDRAQVILVLTGIGATSVDSRSKEQPDQIKSPMKEVASIVSEPIQLHPFSPSPVPQLEMVGANTDLDIPAFLRRRVN
jgi:cell division protein FtsZ